MLKDRESDLDSIVARMWTQAKHYKTIKEKVNSVLQVKTCTRVSSKNNARSSLGGRPSNHSEHTSKLPPREPLTTEAVKQCVNNHA